MVRRQVVEPDRVRPAPVEQRPVQLVSGTHAWNLAAARRRAGHAPRAAAAARRRRRADDGDLDDAARVREGGVANNATVQPVEGGSEVTFTMDGKYRYVGRINAQNHVERVQTWIDNTVLGDTPVEIAYSDYRDFGGMLFPARIVRHAGRPSGAGAHGVRVSANPPSELPVPERCGASRRRR